MEPVIPSTTVFPFNITKTPSKMKCEEGIASPHTDLFLTQQQRSTFYMGGSREEVHRSRCF